MNHAAKLNHGLVEIYVESWSDFASVLDGTNKTLKLQYVEHGDSYELFALDGRIVYRAWIFKSGSEPSSMSAEQIAANASALQEFTDNFQADANKQIEPSAVREDGVPYAIPKPSLYGSKLCDRDFRVTTSTVTQADAIQDLRQNPATLLEEDWGELSLVGVYKDSGGAKVECDDQLDADANGTLSVFSYMARHPGSGDLISYELRDGMLYVDPSIFADASAPTAEERFGHRAYAVIAPLVPGAQGGNVGVFDGYLGNPGLKIKSLSPQAEVLDPTTAAGAAGAEIRLYLHHPAGSKLSHVLRLVTYRPTGSFA